MAYDTKLADRVREHLTQFPEFNIREKKMFGGLAFLINGKMCINVSGRNLMCRYDTKLEQNISQKRGFKPMVMKGKVLKGYCYVQPPGFNKQKDFDFWMEVCLQFNKLAKATTRR